MEKVILSMLATLFACGLSTSVVFSEDERQEPIEVFIVPFSHMDLSWMGTQRECESRAFRIFAEAIQRLQVNPNYRFFIDSTYMLERYIALHPEKLDSLKKLIVNGQIEINPTWGIPHTDDSIGEDNVRNILYAKKFIRENFGIDPIVLSYTDLPEWMVQTPQILKECGIKFVLKNRLGPKFGSPPIWWEGLDGSKILTGSIGYGPVNLLVFGITVDAKTMKGAGLEDYLKREAKRLETNKLLFYLGADLLLPLENLERNLFDWNKISKVKIHPSTFSEYYQKVKDTPGLPEYKGEVPDPWMLYKETAYAKTFQDAQKASNLLLTAEKLATLSYIMGYKSYPGQRIEESWKKLSRSDDHNYDDIGRDGGDRTKLILREEAKLTAQNIIDESLPFIGERVKAPHRDCIPIVVFNPLSWQRDDLVKARFTLYPDMRGLKNADWKNNSGIEKMGKRMSLFREAIDTYPIGRYDEVLLKDEKGNQIDFQRFSSQKKLGRGEVDFIFMAEEVPPLGYKTYYVYPVKQKPEISNPFKVEKDYLENQYLKIDIDQAKGTFSIYDKKAKKVIVNNGIINLNSYKNRTDFGGSIKLPLNIKKVEVLERGPIRAKVRIEYSSSRLSIENIITELSLTQKNKVEIDTIVKYDYDNSKAKDILMLSQVFPIKLNNPQFHYGVPYGHNGKDDLMRESGFLKHVIGKDPAYLPLEMWKISRVVQRWLDVSNGDYGFIISSNRGMFMMRNESIECMLLGGKVSGPTSEAFRSGKIVSHFSIAPHSGSWKESKAYRSGWELNSPLIPYTVQDTVSEKTLPASFSFLSSSSGHDIITVLKKEEKGDGIIVRLFEAEGKDGKAVIRFFRPAREVYETNLIEEKRVKVDLNAVDIDANEIKTLNLILK